MVYRAALTDVSRHAVYEIIFHFVLSREIITGAEQIYFKADFISFFRRIHERLELMFSCRPQTLYTEVDLLEKCVFSSSSSQTGYFKFVPVFAGCVCHFTDDQMCL